MGGNFYEAGGSAPLLAGAVRPPGLWAADGRSGAEDGAAGAIGLTGAAGPVTTSKSPSELGRDMSDLLWLEAALSATFRDVVAEHTKAASGG